MVANTIIFWFKQFYKKLEEFKPLTIVLSTVIFFYYAGNETLQKKITAPKKYSTLSGLLFLTPFR
jgi:hypothetical protein